MEYRQCDSLVPFGQEYSVKCERILGHQGDHHTYYLEEQGIHLRIYWHEETECQGKD